MSSEVTLYSDGALANMFTYFSGLIPCKVVNVTDQLQNTAGVFCRHVVVRLTADRGPYRKGETIICPQHNVIPRPYVYWRNRRQHFNYNGWAWATVGELIKAAAAAAQKVTHP